MGQIFSEIYVDRRLSTKLRKVNARRKKKGKKPHGKQTTITVRDMEVLRFPVGKFYVRSSDLPCIPLSKGWSSGALRRLDDRRREGGEEKGRLLWGVMETLTEKTTVAALTYHYVHDGEITITSIEATTELSDKRPLIEQAMTIAAERIALETCNGAKGRVLWEVRRDEASRIKDKLGFHEHSKATAKSRVVLARDADVASLKAARSVAR